MKNISTIGALVGGGIGVGIAATLAKISKKPIGCKGSIAHILSNDKLDKQAKKDTFVQINKETLKDTGKFAGLTAGVAGAAAIAAKTTKGSEFLLGAKNVIGNALANVSIKGKDLKSMITNTKIFKNINNLPKPAKAAIGAAAAALAFITPLWMIKSSTDAGYIEAQNEK